MNLRDGAGYSAIDVYIVLSSFVLNISYLAAIGLLRACSYYLSPGETYSTVFICLLRICSMMGGFP